jgi:hypothetical protein
MHEFELRGLDGANLLAFLASLGVLRVLTNVSPDADVRMKWARSGGWVPVILHSRIGEREELIEMLAQRVCGERSVNAAWEIGNDLTLSSREFAALLSQHAKEAQPDLRETADYLTAFGSEAVGSGPKKEQMSDTEFRTMSGAGHQHFLGFMKDLAIGTEPEHLRRALFETWDYADPRPSLRWDPADYRPHALRAEDPSGDPIKTMRGANRLAIEALPLFPTVPIGRQLRTVAFQDRNGETEITWPIWSEPLRVETVASLLAFDEIQAGEIQTGARSRMARRNIAQVFRAKRFTDSKYRNFSPPRSLM